MCLCDDVYDMTTHVCVYDDTSEYVSVLRVYTCVCDDVYLDDDTYVCL